MSEPQDEPVTGTGRMALPRVTGARHAASEAMLAEQAEQAAREESGDGE